MALTDSHSTEQQSMSGTQVNCHLTVTWSAGFAQNVMCWGLVLLAVMSAQSRDPAFVSIKIPNVEVHHDHHAFFGHSHSSHDMVQCTESSYNQTATLCLSAQQSEGGDSRSDRDSHSDRDRVTNSH